MNENRNRYGVLRVAAVLRRNGVQCSKNRVHRIMKENNLHAKTRRAFRKTTIVKACVHKTPDLVKQDFQSLSPNTKWTSDITYIKTTEGWLYLCVVLDIFNRQIVGWSTKKNLGKELVLDAFNKALLRRNPVAGTIFHSDRGCQYTSDEFRQTLEKYGFQQSMGRKGTCYDNAITESFFSTLKKELIYGEKTVSFEEMKRSIFEYIEVFYNRKRLHSALNYTVPIKYIFNPLHPL